MNESNLSKMNLYIPIEKEKAFRKLIIDVYGIDRGSINNAVAEAIDLWMEKYVSKGQPKKEQISSASKKQSSQLPEIRPVAVPEKEYVF